MDETLYMYLVEGKDSIGDPIRALVTAKDSLSAKAKVREDFEGTVKALSAKRITGYEWDEALKGYGSRYGGGPYPPERLEDFPGRASKYGVSSGRPVFL